MGEEAPGYTVTVETDRIVVRHTGAVTMEGIKTFRRDLTALTTTRHLSLILIDLSHAASVSVTMVDLYELCASHWTLLSPRVAVAVVYQPDQIPAQDVQFARTTSRNQGVRLEMFVDLESAHRWLSDWSRPVTLD